MSDTTIVTVSRDELAKMLEGAVSKAVALAAESSQEMWTAVDMAKHYGVSVRTLFAWHQQPGRLPPKQGRGWRKGDVLRWDRERAAAGAEKVGAQ